MHSESEFGSGDFVAESQIYKQYRESLSPEQSPQNVGLTLEDFQEALADPGTISVEDKDGRVPILVPTKKLYWYNQEFLEREFGDAQSYIFVGSEFTDEIKENIRGVISAGSVVLLAEFDGKTKSDKISEEISDEETKVKSQKLRAFINQYIGLVSFEGSEDSFETASSYRDTYLGAVEDGDIEQNENINVSIEEVIDDDQIDRLWEVYRAPFKDISTESPISAGYDEEGFKRAMKDPSVVKVVNKDKGVITTLALFETTLDEASWLNPEFYKKEYKDALETGNLLLFTGIVSDEEMRGSSYSADVINMLLKVASIRGQKQVITFECNEVSSDYLPKIVDSTINGSDIARVTGLDKEVSRVVYHALQVSE